MLIIFGSLFIISLSFYYFMEFLDKICDFIDGRPIKIKTIIDEVITIIELIGIIIFIFVFGHLIF